MSEDNAPAEKTFQQRCDEYIAVANQQFKETEVENVNAALLFSAARFTTFSTVRQFDDVEKLKENQQSIIDYFTQRYTEMMAQNFEEYIERFDDYVQK
jgi:hypothetical protein